MLMMGRLPSSSIDTPHRDQVTLEKDLQAMSDWE